MMAGNIDVMPKKQTLDDHHVVTPTSFGCAALEQDYVEPAIVH